MNVALPRKKKTIPVFIDEKDLGKLYTRDLFGEGFDGIRDLTLMETLFLTGMRRAELIGLRNEDVDLSDCTVKVTGKRNKQRIIPIVIPLKDRLEEYIKMRNEVKTPAVRGLVFYHLKGE